MPEVHQPTLTNLADAVNRRRLNLTRAHSELGLLQRQSVYLKEQIATLESDVLLARDVRVLFENLTDRKREQVREKIEALVTHGIRSVFGPNYTFHIEQRLARNNVTFEYRITTLNGDQKLVTDLRGSHGGGLVALTGVLLRLVMVLFSHPPRRRVILLDETMAALDGDKRAPFATLLRTLSDRLGIQFFLITHSEEYAVDADRVFRVTPNGDGTSRIVLDQ